MLGSDPLSALLGAGLLPASPKAQWKVYLRQLVSNGFALAMLGPDVVAPADADGATLRALQAIAMAYPAAAPMPVETSGRLAGASVVEIDSSRVNARVDAYHRRLGAAVKGTGTQKEAEKLVGDFAARGLVTPTVGLHVSLSKLVAVEVPDAAAMQQWQTWAVQVSGDHREMFAAPTVLDPARRGGGVFLFRADATDLDAGFDVGGCSVTSGDVVVPIPPSTRSGSPITRLGPCRRLPDWLRAQLHHYRSA